MCDTTTKPRTKTGQIIIMIYDVLLLAAVPDLLPLAVVRVWAGRI